MIQVSHPNPIAPVTAPTADELYNAHQMNSQAMRGAVAEQNTGSGYNPYAPAEPTQQDAQEAHKSMREQFLAPVPLNQYDITADQSPEQKEAFHDNLIHDPWTKKHGEAFTENLRMIKEAVMNGQLDESDAKNMIMNYGQNDVNSQIDDIYHPERGTHKEHAYKSMHDAEHAAFLKGGK